MSRMAAQPAGATVRAPGGASVPHDWQSNNAPASWPSRVLACASMSAPSTSSGSKRARSRPPSDLHSPSASSSAPAPASISAPCAIPEWAAAAAANQPAQPQPQPSARKRAKTKAEADAAEIAANAAAAAAYKPKYRRGDLWHQPKTEAGRMRSAQLRSQCLQLGYSRADMDAHDWTDEEMLDMLVYAVGRHNMPPNDFDFEARISDERHRIQGQIDMTKSSIRCKGDRFGKKALALARLETELRARDAFDPVPENRLPRPRLPEVPSRQLLHDIYSREVQQDEEKRRRLDEEIDVSD